MLRIVSGVLVVLGIVGGTLFDPARSAPLGERGEYKIVEADFHAHSHFGDGILSPFSLVLHARRQGLDAIAITDHNQIFGAKCGRWFSSVIGGPTVLVGEEITAPGFHMIGVGLNARITWRQSAADAITEIHQQGGIAIAAHPGRKYWPAFDQNVIQKLDGSEVMHPRAYASAEKGIELHDFYRNAVADGRRLTAVGSSDYHWFNSLGILRTYVFVRDNDEKEILDALRRGRTVVYDLEGNAYGNPELIQLLQKYPIKRDAGDYNYSGAGKIDVAARTCGWLGIIGLILFRQKKRIVSQ